MADVKTYLLASTLTPMIDVGAYMVTQKLTIASGAANNADSIQLLTIQRAARLGSSHLRTLATLGASATVKLQRNRAGVRVDLTTATTAGGASLVNSSTIGPVDLQAGDVIELLVGGANITGAAGVEVDLLLQH